MDKEQMKNKISKLLNSEKEPVKAKYLAKKIGVTRAEINSVLYANKKIYKRNNEYKWCLIDKDSNDKRNIGAENKLKEVFGIDD